MPLRIQKPAAPKLPGGDKNYGAVAILAHAFTGFQRLNGMQFLRILLTDQSVARQ
jgi:hypothetical protein